MTKKIVATFSTGTPCHRCDTDERLESTGRCRACNTRYASQNIRTKVEREALRGTPCDACREPMDQPCYDEIDGRPRGWLCHRCNLTLGHARESVDRLQALVDYLQNDASSVFINDWATATNRSALAAHADLVRKI